MKLCDSIQRLFDEVVATESELHSVWIWRGLCANPNAISILEIADPKNIHRDSLLQNENALHLFPKNFSGSEWHSVCANKNALHLLSKLPDDLQFCWYTLAKNPNAHEHILKHHQTMGKGLFENPNPLIFDFMRLDTYDWRASYNILLQLAANPVFFDIILPIIEKRFRSFPTPELEIHLFHQFSKNPRAVPWLEKFPHKIDWRALSSNPAALHLLETNPEKISLINLASNPCERAMILLVGICASSSRYLGNSFEFLSRFFENPYAVPFWDKIIDLRALFRIKHNAPHLHIVFKNPAIFVYDYDLMRQRFISSFGQELLATIYSPQNAHKWAGWQIHDLVS